MRPKIQSSCSADSPSDFITAISDANRWTACGWPDNSNRRDHRVSVRRQQLFLRIYGAVAAKYERLLKQRGEIDFEDMVLRAAAHVRDCTYRSPYRYILMDEFQDISAARADLLMALRDQRPDAKLFCVGDDWQSVYRFAGSDLSLMTRFDGAFGFCRRTALDQTFRFCGRLADQTSRFTLKNPSQLPKMLSSSSRSERPPLIIELVMPREPYLARILGEIVDHAGGSASVLVLNRYRVDAPTQAEQRLLMKAHPGLDLAWYTVHSSKGLEADYVIADNLCGGECGFPADVSDDPLLDLVLAAPDEYPHGEERRLFYVAMTRARRRVYLVSPESAARPASCFIEELLRDEGYDKEIRGSAGLTFAACPACRGGRLQYLTSRYGPFYGCSNYPLCSYREEPCSVCHQGYMRRDGTKGAFCEACGSTAAVCPKCRRGLLVRRTGSYGAFMGCTMYTSETDPCRYKQSVPRGNSRDVLIFER